jgi:hypothetical protein
MKKTQKYYWKLVRINENDPTTFTSFIIKRGKYSLIYKIGERTESAMDENGVFVFNTRKNARKFRKNTCSLGVKIFKCMVHGKEISNPVYYSIAGLDRGQKYQHPFSFPEGTKSFPSITLVKQ